MAQALECNYSIIHGCELASKYKQALYEEYEFKIAWWRGGRPVLTQTLENHSLKSFEKLVSICKQAHFEQYKFKIGSLRNI